MIIISHNTYEIRFTSDQRFLNTWYDLTGPGLQVKARIGNCYDDLEICQKQIDPACCGQQIASPNVRNIKPGQSLGHIRTPKYANVDYLHIIDCNIRRYIYTPGCKCLLLDLCVSVGRGGGARSITMLISDDKYKQHVFQQPNGF